MKKLLLCCFLFFVFCFAFSQNRSADSLKALLKVAAHDSTRCRLLFTFIESGLSDSVWPKYNDQMAGISSKYINGPKSGLRDLFLEYYAYSLNNSGYLKMQEGQIFEASEYYYKSLAIHKELNNKHGIASELINLGYLFRQEGNVKKAIDSYHSALKLQLEIDDKKGAATSYNNIGFIFDNQSEPVQALEYYHKALAIYVEVNDRDGIANTYNNMAYIFKTFGDPSCKGSKENCRKLANSKSINYLNKAIELWEDLDEKLGLANSLNLLGGIYDHYGDPDCVGNDCAGETNAKALQYYERALKLRIEMNSPEGISQSYNSLAEYMLRQGNFKQALDYGLQCLKTAKELGSPERIRDAALTLKVIYGKLHQPQEALNMYELYIQMRDSVYNQETKESAIKKGFQIEYEKKATADSVRVSEEKKVVNAQLKQERTQRFALYGGLILVALFGVFMYNRFRITQKQNHLIREQKAELQKQKELVEEHQKETLDSIHYAKRIQTALLANADMITQSIPGNFILFQPKDIVSGDFYWAATVNSGQVTVSSNEHSLPTADRQLFYLAVCDSTGHGVPGAFMSLLNMGFLSEAIKEKNIEKPNEIFNYVRQRLISTIGDEGQKDGMDGILIKIDKNKGVIEYCAANNSPVLIRSISTAAAVTEVELIELPKDKMPVGQGERTESFTLHSVELKPGDTLYLYTDGYADQFGGPKGKKFKYRQLNELLLSLKNSSLADQKGALESAFANWKGNQEQVDDVLVIGIKI